MKFSSVQNVSNKKGPAIKTENKLPDSLNEIEKKILNLLQKDFGFEVRPFALLAKQLGLEESVLIAMINDLKNRGYITRIGPFFNMDKTNGQVTLVAMKVPEEDFEKTADIVNAFVEVAHNYKRDHEFNMWFVLACSDKKRAEEVLTEIENSSGYKTMNLPKIREFNLDLYLEA